MAKGHIQDVNKSDVHIHARSGALFAPLANLLPLLDKRNCLYSISCCLLLLLPDPGPGIVLALHPTHMIDTDGGTYALLDDAFIRYLRDLK